MKLKNILALTIVAGAQLVAAQAFAQDLMITAVYDGPLSGGTPKGVQLTVLNDIADLSVYGLESANNGDPAGGAEFTFPADPATAGDKIYVASEATQFNNFFGFNPNYTDGAMSINGDDAIILYENTTVIDRYGVEGERPGADTDWNHLDGWAARFTNVTSPNPTFDINEWQLSGSNALDGESDNATAANPIPLDGATPPSGGSAPVAPFGMLILGLGAVLGMGAIKR